MCVVCVRVSARARAILCVHVFVMLCMKMFVNCCMFCLLVYILLICIIMGICALYVFL